MIRSAPELTANSPATLEFYDWTVPSNPTLVDTITFDTRVEDLIPQDDEIADEIGAVRVTQSSKKIIFGEFEFGATALAAGSHINSEADVPLDQVLGMFKPHGRWESYPFADTYNPAADITHMPAYKIVMKAADGRVLHVFEMHDGLPINSPSLRQSRANVPEAVVWDALRPHMHCAMELAWQSHIPTVSSRQKKYFPGIDPRTNRPSQFKAGYNVNAPYPLASGRFQMNGTGNWYLASKWPLASFNGYTQPPGWPGANADPEAWSDPYGPQNPEVYDRTWRLHGWGYEPGAGGTHDKMTGPGGPRFDRCVIPTQIALYMSDLNGTRLKGNVPLRTAVNEYGLNFFNLSYHYISDVQTGATQPDVNGFRGLTSFGQTYYGYGMDYAPGGLQNNIALRAIPNGGDFPEPDRDGHYTWNGDEINSLHNYSCPGWMTYLLNSPMHIHAQKLRYHASSMCQLGLHEPWTAPRHDAFLCRDYAWRLLQQVMSWKLAAKHVLSLDREGIEQRLQIELEAIYDHIYHPAIIEKRNDIVYAGFRNMGMRGDEGGDSQNHGVKIWHDSKVYYMSGVLQLMKQTGCWAAMKAKSERCSQMMDFMIECLDKFCLDYLYYTKGWNEYWMSPVTPNSVPLAVSEGWEAYAEAVPRNGLEDMIHNADGSLRTNQYGTLTPVGENATCLLRWQYVMMRKVYFSEYPHPHLDAVAEMVDGWVNEYDAYVKAAPNPGEQARRDIAVSTPSHGIFLAPSEVGPSPLPSDKPVSEVVVSETKPAENAPVDNTPTQQPHPLPVIKGSKWEVIGNEGDTRTVDNGTWVAYGAGDCWYEKALSGTFTANNALFGDPAYGVFKQVAKLVKEPEAVQEPVAVVVPEAVPTPEPVEAPVVTPEPVVVPEVVPVVVEEPEPVVDALEAALIAAATAYLVARGFKVSK
jgi:hypothetical protein